MPVDLVRDGAVDVLVRVFEKNKRLDESLDRILRRRKFSDRGRRFLTQLAYGTVRHKMTCDFALTPLLHQPLDELPFPILVILRMGIFQSLMCKQVTHPAMVHTSVDLAKRKGHAGTARLVNAVLRRAPQSFDDIAWPDIETKRVRYLSVRYSIPKWIVRAWIEEYGEDEAEKLCDASSMQAPTTIRTNTLKTSTKKLIVGLNKSGYLVKEREVPPDTVDIIEGPKLIRSKSFQNGHFFIQDAASTLPGHLLGAEAGELILDMCAAPGGKTTHIAQLVGGESLVVSCDLNLGRLDKVVENVERLETPGVALVCADGERPPFDAVFDRILVDAPCSGIGTMRRHPDLKWRMDPDASKRLAGLQLSLLRSAVRLCKNGGVIVYSVCTFTSDETTAVISRIIKEGNLETEDGPDWFDQWKIEKGQYRTLPTKNGADGFFLTRLRKVS